YGVVLDAGSTHTDLMVYRWLRKDVIQQTGLVEQIGQCTSKGGSISSYSTTDPNQAGSSFQSCIDGTAKKLIPSYLHSKSPIYLGATAGMRLIEKVNREIARTIMRSVRQTLYNSNFMFEDHYARIISGVEEGLSSWVTVNYLKGKLLYREILSNSSKGSNAHLLGALDMGGASTQITFIPSDNIIMPSMSVQRLRLYGRTYQLYTHSYLCYGKKEAERKFIASLVSDWLADGPTTPIVDNPCAPIGLIQNVSIKYITQLPCVKEPSSGWHFNGSYVTVSGSSNISQCMAVVKRLFDFSQCPSPSNCSFNGVYQPPTKGLQFVAFSSYYYLIHDLNVSSNATLRKFKQTADSFCRMTWSKIIQGKSPSKAQVLKTVCFDAQYIYAILTQAYHINDSTTQIQFTNMMRGRSLGWALGFMINSTNLIPNEEPEYRVKTEAFLAVVIVGAILISLGILLTVMSTRRVIDRWKLTNTGLST
ncbi:hypothetical protein QZH41_009111, partial [Actinostola sp. cb2023]